MADRLGLEQQQAPRFHYGVRLCPEPVHWGGTERLNLRRGHVLGANLCRAKRAVNLPKSLAMRPSSCRCCSALSSKALETPRSEILYPARLVFLSDFSASRTPWAARSIAACALKQCRLPTPCGHGVFMPIYTRFRHLKRPPGHPLLLFQVSLSPVRCYESVGIRIAHFFTLISRVRARGNGRDADVNPYPMNGFEQHLARRQQGR